jgi:hypothetical protein
MYKSYVPIKNDIYGAQKLIEFLVINVWSVADNKRCQTRLNPELKSLSVKYEWFKNQINLIYKVCKGLSTQERDSFKNAFQNNNRIEELCNGTKKPIPLDTLRSELVVVLIPFFENLYTKFLGWKLIWNKYGTKKSYYDALILQNKFNLCPCCGFGDFKTYYSKGYSPYDHYLPQLHYPFSVINFDNLVPLCHSCNSDYKGSTDILENGRKVFYPFASNHPQIEVEITVDKTALVKLINKVEDNGVFIDKQNITITFNPKDDRIDSWDIIFKIKDRYFNKVADNRVSWLDDVRKIYRDPDVKTDTFSAAFDKVVELDSDKHLGFLKSGYLKNLKSYNHLIKAMDEVSKHSKINQV